MEYATYLKNNPSILGQCFDLLDYGMLQILKAGYDSLVDIIRKADLEIPRNLSSGC